MSEEMNEIKETAVEEVSAAEVAEETVDDAVVEATDSEPTSENAEATPASDAPEEEQEEEEESASEESSELTGIAALQRKSKLTGTVTRLELYGAFIDVGLETQALIHISKLGNEHVNRVADVLSVGQEVTVWVEKADAARNQIMVTMIEPLAVEWRDLKNGQVYTGTVSRLENYGAFINIGAEREGLVHISELSHDYVKQPSEVVNVGDEVQVQVLGFSKRKRRIDLSMKALMEKPEQESPFAQTHQYEQAEAYDFQDDDDDDGDVPTAMEFALRKAFGDDDFRGGDGRRRGKGNKKKRRRRERGRAQQDALLERTLYGDD